MQKLIFYFVLWAALGGGIYWLLKHLGLPLEWLLLYGFGSMALLLVWAGQQGKK